MSPTLVQLWLPILVAAVAVFVVSSLVHMVLKWHVPDYHGFSNEDEVLAAIRKGNPSPGIHMLPFCKDMKDLARPEVLAKFREGPTAKIVLRAGADPGMGKPLLQWFVFCLLVSVFCAYLGTLALPAGSAAMPVFRVIGTAAFMAYAFGAFIQGIWWGQPWGAVAKDVLDGILFALATAGAFAGLWPA